MRLSLDDGTGICTNGESYASGSFWTRTPYGPGHKFEGLIRPAQGSGTVNGFFLYNWSPYEEEIDF